MPNRMEFQTKLWRRGKNSHASTVPKEILAIKGAPVGEGAILNWSINAETGAVEVSFGVREDE